ERRERPLLTMADMGMDHGAMDGMDHGGMDHDDAGGRGMPGMQHGHGHGGRGGMPEPGHDGHAAGARSAMAGGAAGKGDLRPPGTLPEPKPHGPDGHGPGQAGLPMMTRSRLHEPGIGLGEDGWRGLVYTDLKAVHPNPDLRPPDREIELHLTGNMERFMWSIDGVEFSDAEPIRVEYMERIRLTLVNDTMMNHPMHLHGMWMELENGHGEWIPRVHT